MELLRFQIWNHCNPANLKSFRWVTLLQNNLMGWPEGWVMISLYGLATGQKYLQSAMHFWPLQDTGLTLSNRSVVCLWDRQMLVGCDILDARCCVYQTQQLLDVTLNSPNRQWRCCFTFQFAFGQKQVSPFLQNSELFPLNTPAFRLKIRTGITAVILRDKMSSRADKGWGSE